MKIGLAQINIAFEDKAMNKQKCIAFLKRAKENQVDFVIFPEMSLTGFSMKVEMIGEENDETLNWLKNQAEEFKLYIGLGHVVNANNKGLNKFTIASPEGKIACSYTKIHPFSYSSEDKFYQGGNEIVYTQINDFNTVPFICYDLRFPEIFQIASKGSDLIIVAANWPKSRRDHWITLLKARALENQCYVAGVNAVGIVGGLEYSGDSMIIDPAGKIIAGASGKEELITGIINLEEVVRNRSSFPLKQDRKEELYYSLKLKKA
jgi:omega-amidase